MIEIAIVDVDEKGIAAYENQLRDFFGERALVRGYVAGEHREPIEGGVILVSSLFLTKYVFERLANPDAEIIHISSTFSKQELDKIRRIPAGSDVLVHSAHKGLTYNSIEQFKRAVPADLHYIPYFDDDGSRDLSAYDYVVTFNQEGGPKVKRRITLDMKKIHPHIFEQIVRGHFQGDAALAERLAAYRQTVIDVNFSANEAAKIFNEWSDISYQIADSFDKGVIILDENNVVKDYNFFISKLFSIHKKDFENRGIEEAAPFREIFSAVEKIGEGVHINLRHAGIGKNLIVSKKIIQFYHMDYIKIIFIELPNLAGGHAAFDANCAKFTFEDIIYRSEAIGRCITIAKRIANSNGAVLLTGETGTGKELFAHAIHRYSHRGNMPFMAVNCTAFNENLLESELFGYEPGTFTGALKAGKKGIFELANGGTVFLDEIGDAPLSIQAKLLRVLQEKEIRRIGGGVNISVDVRILSATNLDLAAQVEKGLFRRDLFYRLNTFTLHIPPLRDRREDIWELAGYFLKAAGYGYKRLSPALLRQMEGFSWEGNVRELKNCVDYMGFMSEEEIVLADLPEQYKGEDAALLGSGISPDNRGRGAFGAAGTIAGREGRLPGMRTSGDLPGAPKEGMPADAVPTLREKAFEDLTLSDDRICLHILALLYERPAGRDALRLALAGRGLAVTEYHLKENLRYLRKKGCIDQERGRRGAYLTPEGEELVLRLARDLRS